MSISKDTYKKWQSLAAKELRDREPADLETDYGDLPIKPAYFAEDLPEEAHEAMPGEAPFTRGVRASMYANRPWTIRQYAGFPRRRRAINFIGKRLKKARRVYRLPSIWRPHRGL